MADLSITAANVVPSSSASKSSKTVQAGATIAAGDLVYVDTDGKIGLADANVAAKSVIAGIAVNGGSAGQPVTYVTKDTAGLTIAASGLTIGNVYIASGTAGKMCPVADATTGWWVTPVAVVISATAIAFDVTLTAPTHNTGSAVA